MAGKMSSLEVFGRARILNYNTSFAKTFVGIP
jgi:hypothetical protein